MNNHLILPHIKDHVKTPYAYGNPGPGLGQAQTCGWVKLVNVIPPLDNRISNSNIDINKLVS
jgi:hypothetical protein